MAHRYPDWYNATLESQVALHHDLSQSNICIGTGATEIIRLIADAFLDSGDELITATPTYFQMESEAIANGARVVYIPVDENYVIDLQSMIEAITEKTRLISLVNPNNPLATIIKKADMQTFLSALPENIVVVVDEAYHHYVRSSDYESCIRYIGEGLSIIVVRTFSKAYGLAGARIGYSVASANHTAQISSSQMFGTISNISQAGAQAALGDADHLKSTIALNDEAKGYLKSGIRKLRLDFIDSESNFLMFDTGSNAGTIALELFSRGYQVRTGWGMPQHIRISTGIIAEMQGFMQALQEIMGLSAITDTEAPRTFGLQAIYPNPFNTLCKIKIATVGQEKVQLIVYDLAGRKVRSLINYSLTPGEHDITWDGRDVHGGVVASGVYFIHLIQGEFATSRRAVLVR